MVVGGGFGGLQAVRKLRRAPVEITLVDRRNFHLFQPLVYQVATGALSPGEVAAPLRGIFKRSKNVRVLLGEVTGFDLDGRRVLLDGLPDGGGPRDLPYDSLIVAGGSQYSYVGHDEWRALAPDVKSLESALEVRRRILTAFEAAEVEEDPARRAAWLTFVVVGAGPTGVEMAGQIGELARDTLRRDFRAVDTRAARILLVELADRVLTEFPPSLSERAARSLEQLGVTPLTGHRVVDIGPESVTLADPAGVTEPVAARTVIWAAGVVASGLAGRARRRVRRGARPRGPCPRRPGPDAGRASRGDRARRHGPGARPRWKPGPAAGGRAGRDAAGPLRGPCGSRSAPRP